MALGLNGFFARQRAQILARRGRAYRRRGLSAQALEAFSAAASLAPSDSRHHLDHGNANLEMGDYVAAQCAFQRSLALSPAQPKAWLKLADAFSAQGQSNFALRAHRAALTFDPWSAAASDALVNAGHGTDVQAAAVGVGDLFGAHTAQIQALSRHMTQLLDHLTTMKALSLEMVRQSTALEKATSDIVDLRGDTGLAQDVEGLKLDLASHKASIDADATRNASTAGLIDDLQKVITAIASEQTEERLTWVEEAIAAQAVILHNSQREGALLGERVEKLALRPEAVETAAFAARDPDVLTTTFADQTNDMLGYLSGRVEFVRRELLYEFHHGPRRDHLGGENLRAASRIVNQAALDAQGDAGFKLNLGCGHILLDGYINVDRRELPGVDIVAEVDDIPLPAGSMAEIHSAHLLEHFPKEELVRKVIPYWRSLLRPGGVLSAVVPDGEAMMKNWVKGDYPFEDLREVMFGAQDYMGDYHYNLFTPDSLTTLLNDEGFHDVSVVESGRRNGQCFELEIRATLSDKVIPSKPPAPPQAAPTF